LRRKAVPALDNAPTGPEGRSGALSGPGFAFLSEGRQTCPPTAGEKKDMTSKPGLTKLFTDTISMSVAANTVIAVRLTKMALGVVDPKHEGVLMVSEKIEAATEATFEAARSFAAGEGHRAAGRAVAVYKKRVDGNLRRLTKG
jgi:hypothetical protein